VVDLRRFATAVAGLDDPELMRQKLECPSSAGWLAVAGSQPGAAVRNEAGSTQTAA
jgi:hypothetical protein